MAINNQFSIEGVNTYLFDLDNTLYHASTGLMDAMVAKMRGYVANFYNVSDAEAEHICQNYWQTYGTTLCGLMAKENINPYDFLKHVHDVDLSILQPCPLTRNGLEKLEGRKIIFTNADRPHAERVLERLGIADLFEDIYDVIWADYRPKPDRETYERLAKHLGLTPANTLMLEDTHVNLKTAHDMGMKTVLIHGGTPPETQHDHIHHMAACMPSWFSTVTKAPDAA